MNKIHSQELYTYLLNNGVLGYSDEIIKAAKKEYRKEYKRKWKRAQLKHKPELRPNFTKKELESISKAAKARGLTNTNFIRQSAIVEASKTSLIANKEQLLLILQKVSMAGILVANKHTAIPDYNDLNDADTLLKNAEQLLMTYLGYDH
jgi:uncharacterized protein (DUF1778 family)